MHFNVIYLLLGLTSGLFRQVFRVTFCINFSHACYMLCPVHSHFLVWSSYEYWVKNTKYEAPHDEVFFQPPVTSSLCGPNILSTVSSDTHHLLYVVLLRQETNFSIINKPDYNENWNQEASLVKSLDIFNNSALQLRKLMVHFLPLRHDIHLSLWIFITMLMSFFWTQAPWEPQISQSSPWWWRQ
jgi:hypothetical protein